MHTPRVLLLYNPITGHGHADSWLALFARVLLARGHGVQVLTPGRDAFVRRMGDAIGDPALEILEWHVVAETEPLAARAIRAADRLCFAIRRYARRAPDSLPTPNMPLGRRLKKRLLHLTLPPLHGLLARAPMAGWPGLRWGDLPAEQEDDTNAWYLDPEAMARRLAAAVGGASRPPDLVINMLLDKYRQAPRRWQAFARHAPLPWAGIRFLPPPPARREACYSLRSLRGMCLLDEALQQAYAQAMPDRPFALLPDVTFADLPESESPLVAAIRERARGRRIVFLGGAIRGQKNPEQWERLIRMADPARWFFVMAGEICRNALSGPEAMAVDRLLQDPPEHFFAHSGYVDDEREFNALIALTDVIFAVYKQFPYSSNMLGKAASFDKPLLAAAGYLVGARVEQFGIGRTVAEDDAQAMLAALESLVDSPVPAARFAACREALSDQRLAQVLEQFIHQCLQSNA